MLELIIICIFIAERLATREQGAGHISLKNDMSLNNIQSNKRTIISFKQAFGMACGHREHAFLTICLKMQRQENNRHSRAGCDIFLQINIRVTRNAIYIHVSSIKFFLAKNGSSPEIFTFYEERVCFLGKGNSQVCGDFSLAMKNNPYIIIA